MWNDIGARRLLIGTLLIGKLLFGTLLGGSASAFAQPSIQLDKIGQ